jgi:O-antigen/teichoic acid export membrane protein
LDKHFIELLRGASAGLLARVASSACVFLFGVVIARRLGATDSGIFYLAVAIVSVPAVLCRAGLDGSVVRFVAGHVARDEVHETGAVYGRSVLVIVSLCVLATGLVLSGSELISTRVFGKPELSATVSTMAWLLAPLALLMIHGQFLQAEKKVAAAIFSQTGMLPLISLAMIFLWPGQLSISTASSIYVLSTFSALAVALVLYRFFSSSRPVWKSGYDFSPLAESARSLAVSDLVNKVIQPWAPIILLGIWGTAAQVGLYAAANRLAALVVFATMPVNRILAPKIATLWAESDHGAFHKLARQATWLMLAVSVPVALALVLMPDLMPRVFGEEFDSATSILMILALGQLLNAVTGPVRAMLVMSGHEKDHRQSSMAGGLAIVITGVVLIPELQANGAALSAAAGLIVNNMAAAWLVWKRLGVLPLWK